MSIALTIWLAAAVAPAIDMKNLPTPLACSGGEPFWSLQIHDASHVRYKDDLGETTLRIAKVENAMLRPSTWRITFTGKKSRALIFDESPKCSDSDGDEPLPYGLILELKGGFLRGCCTPVDR